MKNKLQLLEELKVDLSRSCATSQHFHLHLLEYIIQMALFELKSITLSERKAIAMLRSAQN